MSVIKSVTINLHSFHYDLSFEPDRLIKSDFSLGGNKIARQKIKIEVMAESSDYLRIKSVNA